MKFYRRDQLMAVIGIGIWLALVVFIVGGWGQNLYKLCKSDFESPYKTEIIRGIGIIPPVGAVVGWMDIGEEVS